jgi:protein N-terminal amidase
MHGFGESLSSTRSPTCSLLTISHSVSFWTPKNPKDFIAPFDLFEFATHAKSSHAQLVLCCMNWLVSEPPEEDDEALPNEHREPADDWEEVEQTLSYFALRMAPMIGSDAIFVGCNRVGTERGTTFTGSSCIMKLGQQPSVLEYASKGREQVLLTSVEVPPRLR